MRRFSLIEFSPSAVLYSLPFIRVGKKQIALPCPDGDLLQLAGCLMNSSIEGWTELLTRSPSMLLFMLVKLDEPALAMETRGHLSRREPIAKTVIESCNRLAASSFGDALKTIDRPPAYCLQSNVLLKQALADFADSRTPVKLRKSLENWLIAVASLKRKSAKRFLKGLFHRHALATNSHMGGGPSSSSSLVTLALKKRRKSDLYAAWQSDSNPNAVAELLVFVARKTNESFQFDRQLHEAKLLAIKQLAYGASHEINNPLANIATRAQSLLIDEPNPDRRHKLATIYEQSMRAHEMISDLMLFANPAAASMESADLYELINDVARELRAELKNNSIQLRVVRYPDIPTIECDPTKISVAIRALIQNCAEAINSSPNDRPQIDIRIWNPENDHVLIAVSDNGPGIAPDVAKHIFDPFYSGREAGRGLGFGLSKAWTIISQLHRGTLELRDTKVGAEFQIMLPVTQPIESSRRSSVDHKPNSKNSAA